jgi:hypothetical protein
MILGGHTPRAFSLGWPSTMLLLLSLQQRILLLFVSLVALAHSYPVVIQVDDSSKRCFRFNVPEDDE